MHEPDRIGRRQFAASLAAGSTTVAVSLASSVAMTAEDQAPIEPKADAKPNDNPAAAPPPEEVLVLMTLLQRYPSEHFNQTTMQGILRDLRSDAARGAILSAFPLTNSDEPSFVFRAYRDPQS